MHYKNMHTYMEYVIIYQNCGCVYKHLHQLQKYFQLNHLQQFK